MNVRVISPPTSEWTIIVTLNPAPSGWITVVLGELLYRAPLLRDGSAQIPGIPAALLGAHDGPPLEIGVELAPS
jgi:hypothetical protein